MNKTELNLLIQTSYEAEEKSGYNEALYFLEKAHIVSQPYAWPHFYVHALMLKLAWRHRVWKEVLGQIPRLILAMPGSWTGRAPKGNLGSTKMGIFEENC